jgi:hypothetical protein
MYIPRRVNPEVAMAKKKNKPRKQNNPKSKGRKNEIFVPKKDSEHRFPQMQKTISRAASRSQNTRKI